MSASTGRDTILHLSDVHATYDELLYGHVDGLARLEEVGDHVVEAGLTPEVVVVSGDLVQRGHQAAYPQVAAALGRLASTVGAPVLTVLGNHDEPTAARMLPGHGLGHHRAVRVGGLRFVLLDTNTGRLDPAQLAWLRAVLREPHGRGSVLVMHHPPIASPLPALAGTGLQDPNELASAIAGSDVRVVLAGHYHHPMNGAFSGLPVSVGPSLAYQQVIHADPGHVSGCDLSMYAVVHVWDTGLTSAPVFLSADQPLFTQSVRLSDPIPTT